MSNVENLEDHMAFSCKCGCVRFNLLKSGGIECDDCGEKVDSTWGTAQPEQEPVAWVTKEQLLQDWLPRLCDALKDVRHKENASAEETLYELYVEMNQQTIAEKLDTLSEITLEDKMSVLASELLTAQKRVSELELIICQRNFMVQQELEPVAFLTNRRQRLNVEFNATGLTLMPKSVDWKIPLYTTPPQRTWVGLTDEDVMSIAFNFDVSSLSLVAKAIEAKLKEKNT